MDDNIDAMAGYLTKLASELTGSGPKNQVPVDAPPHFRRIRASRGLLPAKPDPECTGELVKVPLPEYNHTLPYYHNACGAVGQPTTFTGKAVDVATDKGIMAAASGSPGGGYR